MKRIEKILLVVLIVFGFLYSFYLTMHVGDAYIGIIIALITIGLSSTIYVLDKSIDYKIILYIWLAIIIVAVVLLLVRWVFSAFDLFKI